MEQMSKPAFVRWRRWWHPTPVLLPGKSHGWRSLVGCSPWGHWGSVTTEGLYFHLSLSCTGEGNASHSSVLAWRIPGMGEPGGLPSMGSNRVGHYWSYLEAAEAFVRKWAWLAVNSAKECLWPDSCSPREETEKLSTITAKTNLMAQKEEQRSPLFKRERSEGEFKLPWADRSFSKESLRNQAHSFEIRFTFMKR